MFHELFASKFQFKYVLQLLAVAMLAEPAKQLPFAAQRLKALFVACSVVCSATATVVATQHAVATKLLLAVAKLLQLAVARNTDLIRPDAREA